MANTKSAAKRARQTVKRTAHNRSVKTGVKNVLKKVHAAISGGDKAAATATLQQAASELDRAAKRGVIHQNAADRRKSRLNKAVAALA